ncbi:hypothetical protein MKX07_004051 [Trichoderma sp. CBMAI-0711]|nr:hypothetical protein MKX07_004051 [Trichoderma sp. CBMAI-0711]
MASIHNFSPHGPTHKNLALPSQPSHLPQLGNVFNGNGPGWIHILDIRGPAQRRACSRCRDERMALLAAVSRREADRAGHVVIAGPLVDHAQAVACMGGTNGSLGLVGSERRVDAALGGALEQVEDAVRPLGLPLLVVIVLDLCLCVV